MLWEQSSKALRRPGNEPTQKFCHFGKGGRVTLKMLRCKEKRT
jgi:hypothetical protein